jgi:hypothetical protein
MGAPRDEDDLNRPEDFTIAVLHPVCPECAAAEAEEEAFTDAELAELLTDAELVEFGFVRKQ